MDKIHSSQPSLVPEKFFGTEGYWINYETGSVFPIWEHEQWLRQKGNAQRLGIGEPVIKMFGQYMVRRDRTDFLTMILKSAPVMRVRGNKNHVVFEFYNQDPRPAYNAIIIFGELRFTPGEEVVINNLFDNQTIRSGFSDFILSVQKSASMTVETTPDRKSGIIDAGQR